MRHAIKTKTALDWLIHERMICHNNDLDISDLPLPSELKTKKEMLDQSNEIRERLNKIGCTPQAFAALVQDDNWDAA